MNQTRENVNPCPTALGAQFWPRALDFLVGLESSLLGTLLPLEALANRRRGPQVNLVPLVVGVGTTVDRLQLRAEELVLPKPESRLLLDVLGRRHCRSVS